MATKKLTNGNDYLTLLDKKYTQVDALGGNDTVNLTSGCSNGVIVNAGTGDDTVTVEAGSYHTINLAEGGNNTVNLNYGIKHIVTGGVGNDTLTIANSTSITGFNDLVKDSAGMTTAKPSADANVLIKYTASLGRGDDYVCINGGRKHLIYTDGGMNTTTAKGAGNDTVLVKGGQYNLVYTAGGADKLTVESNVDKDVLGNTFATGADNDIIVLSGKGVFGNKIQAGDGVDTITINATNTSNQIWADGGNDYIYIKGGSVNKIYGDSKPTSSLEDGAGNDQVTVTGGEKNYVHTAAGEDYIILSGDESVNNNKLHAGEGSDKLKVNGGYRNFIYGDEDDDKFYITGGTGNYIYGGLGKDNLEIHDVDGQIIFGDNGYADGEADGNDTITLYNGSNNKIYGNGGADVISIKEGGISKGNKLIGGGGDDTITVLTGEKNSVNAGDGDDKLYCFANNSSVVGGLGNDTISIDGAAVASGAGGTLYAIVEGSTYDGGDGADLFEIRDTVRNCTFLGGNGKDEFKVYGSARNCTVSLGADADYINVGNADTVTETTFNTGDGDDTISVIMGKLVALNTFMAGDGNDKITVKSCSGNTYYGQLGDDSITLDYVDSATSDGGLGKDVFTISNCSYGNVAGGIGDDTITLTNCNNLTIHGENAVISATRGTNNDTITLKNTSDSKVYGDLDADKIKIQAASNHNEVYGGQGNDTISIDKSERNTISGGADNDTITVSGYSTTNFIYGDAGSDTLKAYANTEDIRLHGGDDNDYIYVVDSKNCELHGDKGDDTISISSSGVGVNLVELHGKVSGDAGNDQIIMSNLAETYVYGGSGNDYFLIKDNAYHNTVFGGIGDDTITIRDDGAERYDILLVGGAGKDEYNVSLDLGNIYIDAGVDYKSTADADTVTLSAKEYENCNPNNLCFKYFSRQDVLAVYKKPTSVTVTPAYVTYIGGFSKLANFTVSRTDMGTGAQALTNLKDYSFSSTTSSLSLEDTYGPQYLNNAFHSREAFWAESDDFNIAGNKYDY